jgi:rubredoxin
LFSKSFSEQIAFVGDVFTLAENEGGKMQKYECSVCGYIYDPEIGDPDSDIPPGTAFEDLPDDWLCPDCGAEKDMFDPYED